MARFLLPPTITELLALELVVLQYPPLIVERGPAPLLQNPPPTNILLALIVLYFPPDITELSEDTHIKLFCPPPTIERADTTQLF